MKKVIIAIVVVATVAIGGYFFWPRKPAEKSALPGLSQRTAVIKRGDLAALVSATGTVEPIHVGRARLRDKSLRCRWKKATAWKGDLIARIDETDLRNAYEQAVADLEVARATVAQTASNVKRQTELFNRGLLSQAEIDQVTLEEVRAKAQQIKAESELVTVETRLKDAVVRSTINGLVLQKNVESGQVISSGINSVSGGTLIATVANMDSVYIFAEVDEVDIGQVHLGQKAKVVPDAFPEDVFDGYVLRVAPLAKVEQNVTTFNVTVVVSNTSNKLKAGMNASVDLTVADRQDVLLAPKQAVKDFVEIRAQLAAMYGNDSTMAGPRRGKMPDSVRARMRQQFAGGRPGGTDGGMLANGMGNGQGARRFMLVKNNTERFVPRRVQIGVSNFDFAEVVSGVQEGDSVLVFSNSRAAADRQRMMDRMRSMSGFSGFSGSGSSGDNVQAVESVKAFAG
jgi:HlyD family secretion protein